MTNIMSSLFRTSRRSLPPEPAIESLRAQIEKMSDLKGFTRELVGQMEKDLGTRLEWVAVDHWTPSIRMSILIVRGARDDGENLVISRDNIKEGMRSKAQL